MTLHEQVWMTPRQPTDRINNAAKNGLIIAGTIEQCKIFRSINSFW